MPWTQWCRRRIAHCYNAHSKSSRRQLLKQASMCSLISHCAGATIFHHNSLSNAKVVSMLLDLPRCEDHNQFPEPKCTALPEQIWHFYDRFPEVLDSYQLMSGVAFTAATPKNDHHPPHGTGLLRRCSNKDRSPRGLRVTALGAKFALRGDSLS